MNVNIHKPKGVSSNKGSSATLISYLTKEEINEEGDLIENEGFFSQERNLIKAEEAQQIIDAQSKGLKKKDSKFFMLTVNPSQKEIKHIIKQITQETPREINSIQELTPPELKEYHQKLREYTSDVMNIYAEQFDREVQGKKITGEDLVYVGKIEEQREYKFDDTQVKENNALFLKIHSSKTEQEKRDLEKKLHKTPSGVVIQSGLKKEGFQSHVHIVVSRFDKNKTTQLSPLANSRGYSKDHEINGKKIKVGFSRVEFYLKSEARFDEKFQYQRSFQEKKVEHIKQARKKDISKGVDKYGHLDPINIFSYVKDNAINISQGKGISVMDVSEKIKQEMNPIAAFRYKIDPVQQTKTSIKKILKSGGLEM